MADSQGHSRLLNPWVLHFQKLGLELKCPLCLNLYNKPMLLPCNHIFCSSCVPNSNLFESQCQLCKLPYVEQELRQASYMENVVNIYRSMDAAFSMQMLNSDMGKGMEQRRANFPDQLAKGLVDASPQGNTIINPSSFSLMGNKRVQVPSNSISNVLKPTQQEQNKAVDVDVNPVELSPDSSPFTGVSKGVETDCFDAGSSDDTTEKSMMKKISAKRSVDDVLAQGINECNDSCLKKQRQQTQDLVEMHTQPLPSAVLASVSSEMNTKSACSDDRPSVESDSTSLANFTCAFCQTWKTTEGSGPMQHFANGQQVFGSETSRSNVIHVHRRCIEWAPQIFFESDTVVKNVEKELARASKLKCTSCGLKGAALGCLAKSCRRTYHVPCASQIAKCRWDSDEFVMLCPSHASHKFPGEKHRKPALKSSITSTQIYNEQKSTPKADFWAPSRTGAKNWVICGSALSGNEKCMLVKFAKLCGAVVTRAWNPDVTHVVAATDANGACSRTLKVLMAILNGRWILTTEWMEACVQLKTYVGEDPYEISFDNHGCCNGPKNGRVRVLRDEPMLFSGLKFLFVGDFVPTYENDIQDLIIAAGGSILESREQLLYPSNKSNSLVIYNSDALTDTEEACEVLQRQAEAQRVAAETGSRVVAHTWVLDSIASCALQPFAL